MPLQPLAHSIPEAEAEALPRDGEMGAIDSARRRRREGKELRTQRKGGKGEESRSIRTVNLENCAARLQTFCTFKQIPSGKGQREEGEAGGEKK